MTAFEIARSYIGTTEGPGAANNPKIIEMYATIGQDWVEHDDVAWCAAFVGHCLEKAGIRSSRKLTARSYLDWGEAVDLAAVRPGDIGVIPRGTSAWQGHVFFIDRVEGKWLFALGGNQGDAVSVQRYPVSKLIGLRRAPASGSRRPPPIKAVQSMLRDLGYHEVGAVDGVMGSRTRGAVLAFRADHGLPLEPVIDAAFVAALETAKPRAVTLERALGQPAASRIVSAANAQIALGAAGSAGIALTDLAPLITQAEDGRDLATRVLDLVGLGAHAVTVLPLLGAVLFLAIIVFAVKSRAARIEDHRLGKTP
ncbi:TIGR02594 family protein [Paracoccaceae bacterium Fryx2]|nr:TIGR02594 family protein [Paracoccaceae bacterium Fryx2]